MRAEIVGANPGFDLKVVADIARAKTRIPLYSTLVYHNSTTVQSSLRGLPQQNSVTAEKIPSNPTDLTAAASSRKSSKNSPSLGGTDYAVSVENA
jgi:hypothetical protein